MHGLKAVQIFPALYLVALLSLSCHAMANQSFIRQEQLDKDKKIVQWKQERDSLPRVQVEKAANKKETQGGALSSAAFYVSKISLDFGTVAED